MEAALPDPIDTAHRPAQAAVSAILRVEGRYLLVRRPNPPAADLHAFPGGRVEAGETLAAAALRELREETGIEGHNPRFFTRYLLEDWNADGSLAFRYDLSVHLVDAPSDAVSQAIAADDAAGLGWYTGAEIETLPVPESVLECVRRLERTGFEEA